MTTSKRPIRFRSTVDPGESNVLTTTVEEDATIEHLNIRFWRGPELALQVIPRRIPDNGNGRPQDLVDVIGEDYIDGDNDHWDYPLAEPVEEGDVLEVEVVNTAEPDPGADLTFDSVVEMDLDRKGGLSRPFEGVLSTIKGVL